MKKFSDGVLGQAFLKACKDRLPAGSYRIDACFHIPAAHPEVGDLQVMDDGSELTLCLGKLTHWHVACYEIDEPIESERIKAIVENALSDIEELLAGNQIVRVRYSNDGKNAGAWMGSKDMITAPAKSNEQDYSWSGPLI